MDEPTHRIDVFDDEGNRLGFHWEIGDGRPPVAAPEPDQPSGALPRRAAIGVVAATATAAAAAALSALNQSPLPGERAAGTLIRRPAPTSSSAPPTDLPTPTTARASSTTSTTVPATTTTTTTTIPTTTTTTPPETTAPTTSAPPTTVPPTPPPEPAPVPSAAIAGPRLILRPEWQEAPRSFEDLSGGIRTVIVHHTEPQDPVRALTIDPVIGLQELERFAVETRKWSGISYHWIVFNDGTIGEGRGWAKRGAHAVADRPETAGADYNDSSYGIAVHGNYEIAAPSSAALDSVVWTICSGIANGFIRPFPELKGHRDITNTACPGDAFYQSLDYIRLGVFAFSQQLVGPDFGR